MRGLGIGRVSIAGAFAAMLGGQSGAVTIDWVTIGDPGNPADTEVMQQDLTTGYGSVSYVYRISKYEITNAQYAEFLNAVAASDPNELYDPAMDTGLNGGITRSGTAGNFTYSATVGRESWPVNIVTFYDALRFANWLHNGQGSATTEDGAYTITAAGISANSITRNAGAIMFLPSEDEWYKAAYYDAVSMSYFDFPAGSNALTTCAPPGSTPNTANCGPGFLTDVGSYTGSASPYGTFDQGGNVQEWNEAILSSSLRGQRGGAIGTGLPSQLGASYRDSSGHLRAASAVGFRVASIASVPEPGAALLLMMAILGLAARQVRTGRS